MGERVTSIADRDNIILQGVPKKVTVGPPLPQFLSETFEILVVGRLFIANLVLLSDLKNFDFKGPKSMYEIFQKKPKNEVFFFYFFFQANFLVSTNAEKNPNPTFLNQNLIKIRFLVSQL